MEPKRTNRGIAFLCPSYCSSACTMTITRVDLAGNWYLTYQQSIKIPIRLHLTSKQDSEEQITRPIVASNSESYFGVHSAREIPVPIPNTEVKPGRGDYTALRETSKMPNYTRIHPNGWIFVVL